MESIAVIIIIFLTITMYLIQIIMTKKYHNHINANLLLTLINKVSPVIIRLKLIKIIYSPIQLYPPQLSPKTLNKYLKTYNFNSIAY